MKGKDASHCLDVEIRGLPRDAPLTPDELVNWLTSTAGERIKLRTMFKRSGVDFSRVVAALEAARSARLSVAEQQDRVRGRRVLRKALEDLLPAAREYAIDVYQDLRNATDILAQPAPPPLVWMDVAGDGVPPRVPGKTGGRPASFRREVDGALRHAGISSQADRRLLLSLIGRK